VSGEFYVSIDVETDGSIPGDCNMVSVGASVCGTLTPEGFERIDGGPTFYRELETEFPGSPDTRRWLAGQGFEVNAPQAVAPKIAMIHFKEWVDRTADALGCRPVFVAYPLGFDWSFTHWYFEHYLGPKSDPFGFSNALDIKTFFAAKARRPLLGSLKRNMPREVRNVKTPHTHNAKDDAVGQGELFANLMEWTAECARSSSTSVTSSPPMTKHPLVLVGFEPDWEALYVEGTKVAEGHHVEKGQLVEFAQAIAIREGCKVPLETTHVESDEGNEYEEHDIVEELDKLPTGAYERISP
jgi:hypothetical protein